MMDAQAVMEAAAAQDTTTLVRLSRRELLDGLHRARRTLLEGDYPSRQRAAVAERYIRSVLKCRTFQPVQETMEL